jgi:hypothetical protein
MKTILIGIITVLIAYFTIIHFKNNCEVVIVPSSLKHVPNEIKGHNMVFHIKKTDTMKQTWKTIKEHACKIDSDFVGYYVNESDYSKDPNFFDMLLVFGKE